MLKFITRRRFKPLDIAIAMLFAGWIPSILMGVVSHGILKRELESKILVDRNTLVKTLSQLIGYDLVSCGDVLSYYQTLPSTQAMLLRRAGDPGVQAWLAESYYSHPRLDGMFLTDPDGRLTASIPLAPELIGQDYSSRQWLTGAQHTRGYYVSPVHPRPNDQRSVAAIVAPVRSRTGELVGYLGSTLLVERIGKRLSSFDVGEQSVAQVIDQNGYPLFDRSFHPNKEPRPANHDEMLKTLRENKNGHFTFRENLYTFNPIEGTNWTAVLTQPVAVAYKPVRELLSKTVILAGWLIVLTAVVAYVMSRLYGRQIEADAHMARERLFQERILANMPLGIALIDPQTKRFLHTNQSFISLAKRFAGLAADGDMTKVRFNDVHFGIEKEFGRVVEFGVPFEAREQPVSAGNGDPHFFTINLLRLQDVHQTTQGILLLVEDNTGEVLMRQKLIAANTAKDQFLALLSHELRNPLSPVITMVAELEQKIGRSPDAHRALEIIRRNVELEARLIDDLLDVTRIANSKLQLTFEIVDAHQLIHRALEISHSDIEAKKLALSVDLAASKHIVRADPARLQQIFWNLVKNSVKFTEQGELTIRSRNEGDRLVVEVEDTGIGIPADRLDKIFRVFEQGESWVTRRFGGLGLGLAISKAMAEAHGGTLSARSDGDGKGAVFTFEMATVEEIVPDETKATAPDQHDAHRRKILLVDDHEDTCHGMRLLLERRGYHVSVANNVAGALDLAKNNGFELLISDLGLPDGTGFDLIKQLRETHDIRGIALSGFGMESDVQKSREAGFSEHLIKPVNVDRLDSILGSIFENS
ncbi:MAG: ATP-binding protein [Verrucomicrobiota bacterium]|nr:ATP-binding protein [Verrucomicrobiota bacterium]